MDITELGKLLERHPQLKVFKRVLGEEAHAPIFLEGLQGSAAAALFSSLALNDKTDGQRPILFALNDEDEAGYFYHDLTQMLGNEKVLFFPSAFRRAVKYAQRDAANEILRTEVLSRLSVGETRLMIVTYPDALTVKVVSKNDLSNRSIHIEVGKKVGLADLEHRLIDLGLHRTDYVYEPGDFAIRGSIVDIYSYSSELPFRIDFFGDGVDTIRTFQVDTQLSEEKKTQVVIVPEVECVDQARVSLFHFLPSNALIVSKNPDFVRETIQKIYEEGFSERAKLEQKEVHNDESTDGTENAPLNNDLLLDGESFRKETAEFRSVILGQRPIGVAGTRLCFHTTPQPLFHKNFKILTSSLAESIQNGYTQYILADSNKQNERLRDIFAEKNENVKFTPVNKTLHGGFSDDDLKVCIYTDHQIFDRFHKYNLKSQQARQGKAAISLKELNQFQPGDYIVHVDHGIGQFVGLVRVSQGETEQEMMKIVYQNNDVVYVSIHSLAKVSKYKGRDAEPPKLSRLGTGAWEKMKDQTKRKIKDIARDLIKLYAERRQQKGFTFSPDSYMQHELEAGFIYEDTPDQTRVTAEVKADMESSRPMDRLVCGDVGFGKTEIAVRAAFKAASDSKQVCVLVPTTVLAYQHFKTFSDRLKDFPVTIEYLTRARPSEKVRDIKERLTNGQIDIIIGTHKLLGKGIKFKDLGLLIVDEEQRFGVSTKEKLRQMRVNVDTLTLTATPIPRTLQFSIMGARDLSVIQTPPPNRHPIRTEVHQFGHEVIADAINFEMSRGGQVFFVCNRIAKLPEVVSLIQKYVPDARIAVGHGQMPPEKLEKIVFDFINYDYDVLLSTTIIENGIDIPNANTIIIDNAQYFGLSDLHQMRGRVGRSNRKAFCYLLAPPFANLTSDGRRRLETVESFSELGSGIQIAMQDLDIRGAGNLLGAEQSGFIADLGYETYQKILSEAVTELRNEEFADLYVEEVKKETKLSGELFVEDCTLDSDLPLYLAEEYIPGSSERMALYRELDTLHTDEELTAYRKRMEDRFGPMPKEGLDLMSVVVLRRLGRSLGIERILLKNGPMTLYFVSNRDSAFYQSPTFGHSIDYIKANFKRCNLAEINGKRRMIVSQVPSVDEAIKVLKEIAS